MSALTESSKRPAVSVGIPTFNRAALLPRAIQSVIDQTHRDLELIISDNASTDGTQAVCSSFASSDGRVRVLRQQENVGPTENFNALLAASTGRFVMVLSDDDWLESNYLEECLRALADDPGLVAVAGAARYVRGEVPVADGPITNLDAPHPRERVRQYYRQTSDGPFYSLVRADPMRSCGRIQNVLANDWLHVARIATMGRTRMTLDTRINRELGGTSASIAGITSTFGSSSLVSRLPHLAIAWNVFADIAGRAPARERLGGPVRRVFLGLACGLAVIDWSSLAWHATAPSMYALGHRRRGRPLLRAYLRVTTLAGAEKREI